MRATSWPPFGLNSLETNLDRLADAVRNSKERDVDEQIWLTRFLVVRSCGYLEQVVHETVTEFLNRRAGGTALTFALSWMTKSRNPSPENLIALLGRFDHSWQAEFEEVLDSDDNRIRRQLVLLVARRNQIAHGLNEGLTERKALELVETVKEIADWFIRRLDPYAANRAKRVV
ncbi:HEPN domain-containing protein [Lentzea sp. NPDC055074]